MQKAERRRKFHESLLSMLYPSPSSPPPPQEGDEEEPLITTLPDGLYADRIPDESDENGSSSSSDECGPHKLTRSQRKRLRKKKLKEAASRRRKIIGPLLPNDDGHGDLTNEPQGVRCNAAEEPDNGKDMAGEPTACPNQNRLKHRRKAKKLARESSKSSNTENCHQDYPLQQQ